MILVVSDSSHISLKNPRYITSDGRFALMDFLDALGILKAFSECNLRIYKQFAGFPYSGSEEAQNDYVLFFDPAAEKEECQRQLEDFAAKNNLSVKPYKANLMISGHCNFKSDNELSQLLGKKQKVIKCLCGAEILLLPDIKEMEKAIIQHSESHAEKEKNPKKVEAIFEEIQNYLIRQVLVAASEENRETGTRNKKRIVA